jgi:phosphate starvation-inducible PhoH-like protein
VGEFSRKRIMTKRKRRNKKGGEYQQPPKQLGTPTKAVYKLLNEGQEEYWDCLNQYPVVFCDGVFGTGKTFLAALKAVDMLLRGDINKIILCRPAIGTSKGGIGHLPGTLKDKLAEYMRPIVEEVQKVLGDAAGEPKRGIELYRKFVTEGKIVIESLEHIRGHNLIDCFMILDESENAIRKQIDGFVSRMGKNSRVVICGDSNQTDLIQRRQVIIDNKVIWRETYNCDFYDMCESIYEFDGEMVGTCELTEDDIVRSPILKEYMAAVKHR